MCEMARKLRLSCLVSRNTLYKEGIIENLASMQ